MLLDRLDSDHSIEKKKTVFEVTFLPGKSSLDGRCFYVHVACIEGLSMQLTYL